MRSADLLYVALGSAAGGVTRWLLGGALQRRFGAAAVLAGAVPFPVGTLIVNVTGSFLLGALAMIVARQPGDAVLLRLLLMVGFCGGYTTFSAFSVDTVLLVEQGSTELAALNVGASIVLSVVAAFGGMLLVRAILDRA